MKLKSWEQGCFEKLRLLLLRNEPNTPHSCPSSRQTAPLIAAASTNAPRSPTGEGEVNTQLSPTRMGNYLKSCDENQTLSHSILLQLLSFTHKAAWLNLNSVFDCFENGQDNFAMRRNLISWEALHKDKAYQKWLWGLPAPTSDSISRISFGQ